jgi:hypothetical protein
MRLVDRRESFTVPQSTMAIVYSPLIVANRRLHAKPLATWVNLEWGANTKVYGVNLYMTPSSVGPPWTVVP